MRIVLACVLAALPSVALAAGFEYPDQGTAALGQGGAFAAMPTDPTAIYYNPAGIVQQEKSVNVLVDLNAAWNPVTFKRAEGPYRTCVANPTEGEPPLCKDLAAGERESVRGGVKEIANQEGAFLLPFVAATYTLKVKDDHKIGFGLGAHGPSAVGRYSYPAPNYTDENYDAKKDAYVDNPQSSAPERYALVRSDTVIAYPSVSVAYGFRDWVSVGATLQYVYFSADLAQSATDLLPDLFNDVKHPGCDTSTPGTCGPDRMSDEDPTYDTQFAVSVKSTKPIWTGVFGISGRPHPRLAVGASVRPGFTVEGEGTMDLTLSRFAQSVNASIEGNQAKLELKLPTIARAGVRGKLLEGRFGDLSAELDGVYEGWHVLDKMVLTPVGVKATVLGSTRDIAPIIVKKNFQDAYSVRLGVEYKLPLTLPAELYVKLRAGGFYETSAVKLEYTSLDFPNWERTAGTAGFSVGLPNVELVFAAAYIKQPTRTVKGDQQNPDGTVGSQVFAASTDPNLKPDPVGNGVYNSNYKVLSVGLRGHFL